MKKFFKKLFRFIYLFFKYLIFGIVTFIFLFFAYYGIIVLKAKIDTSMIVNDALKSPYMVLEIDDLTRWQRESLLKIEDPNFYEHNGIDRSTPGAGLTTISQSIVKKLYFENFTPGIAKIKQSFIARFAFDPMVEKDLQLKMFINFLWFGKSEGKDVIGFGPAAKVYYGKEVKDLTEDEFLSLVAMIISPKAFHLLENPEANKERVERIKMVLNGDYTPKSLMDLYYGELDSTENLAPASYFKNIYK